MFDLQCPTCYTLGSDYLFNAKARGGKGEFLMLSKQGFTLIEIIVVMVIIGLLIRVAVPSFNNNIEHMKAQTAYDNLLAISAAQQRYGEDYSGTYCVAAGCGDSNANLSTSLRLSLGGANDAFNYLCFAQAGDLYRCTASDNLLTLTMDVTTASGAVIACNLAPSSMCPSTN